MDFQVYALEIVKLSGQLENLLHDGLADIEWLHARGFIQLANVEGARAGVG